MPGLAGVGCQPCSASFTLLILATTSMESLTCRTCAPSLPVPELVFNMITLIGDSYFRHLLTHALNGNCTVKNIPLAFSTSTGLPVMMRNRSCRFLNPMFDECWMLRLGWNSVFIND